MNEIVFSSDEESKDEKNDEMEENIPTNIVPINETNQEKSIKNLPLIEVKENKKSEDISNKLVQVQEKIPKEINSNQNIDILKKGLGIVNISEIPFEIEKYGELIKKETKNFEAQEKLPLLRQLEKLLEADMNEKIILLNTNYKFDSFEKLPEKIEEVKKELAEASSTITKNKIKKKLEELETYKPYLEYLSAKKAIELKKKKKQDPIIPSIFPAEIDPTKEIEGLIKTLKIERISDINLEICKCEDKIKNEKSEAIKSKYEKRLNLIQQLVNLLESESRNKLDSLRVNFGIDSFEKLPEKIEEIEKLLQGAGSQLAKNKYQKKLEDINALKLYFEYWMSKKKQIQPTENEIEIKGLENRIKEIEENLKNILPEEDLNEELISKELESLRLDLAKNPKDEELSYFAEQMESYMELNKKLKQLREKSASKGQPQIHAPTTQSIPMESHEGHTPQKVQNEAAENKKEGSSDKKTDDISNIDVLKSVHKRLTFRPNCLEKLLYELQVYARFASENKGRDFSDDLLKLNKLVRTRLEKEKYNSRLLPAENLFKIEQYIKSKEWEQLELLARSSARLVTQLFVDEIREYLERIKAVSQKINKKCVILLLGDTGTGKSTLCHYLSGSILQKKKVDGMDHIVAIKNENDPSLIQNVTTSCKSVSETRYIYPIKLTPEKFGLAKPKVETFLIDTPGFEDTRGPEIDITNGIGIIEPMKGTASVRIIVLVNYENLGGRLQGITKLTKLLGNILPKFKDYEGSLKFFFTKFPQDKLSDFHARLLDVQNTISKSLEKEDESIMDFLELMIQATEDVDEIYSINPLDDKQRKKILKAAIDAKEIKEVSAVFKPYMTPQSENIYSNKLASLISGIKSSCANDEFSLAKSWIEDFKFLSNIFDFHQDGHNQSKTRYDLNAVLNEIGEASRKNFDSQEKIIEKISRPIIQKLSENVKADEYNLNFKNFIDSISKGLEIEQLYNCLSPQGSESQTAPSYKAETLITKLKEMIQSKGDEIKDSFLALRNSSLIEWLELHLINSKSIVNKDEISDQASQPPEEENLITEKEVKQEHLRQEGSPNIKKSDSFKTEETDNIKMEGTESAVILTRLIKHLIKINDEKKFENAVNSLANLSSSQDLNCLKPLEFLKKISCKVKSLNSFAGGIIETFKTNETIDDYLKTIYISRQILLSVETYFDRYLITLEDRLHKYLKNLKEDVDYLGKALQKRLESKEIPHIINNTIKNAKNEDLKKALTHFSSLEALYSPEEIENSIQTYLPTFINEYQLLNDFEGKKMTLLLSQLQDACKSFMKDTKNTFFEEIADHLSKDVKMLDVISLISKKVKEIIGSQVKEITRFTSYFEKDVKWACKKKIIEINLKTISKFNYFNKYVFEKDFIIEDKHLKESFSNTFVTLKRDIIEKLILENDQLIKILIEKTNSNYINAQNFLSDKQLKSILNMRDLLIRSKETLRFEKLDIFKEFNECLTHLDLEIAKYSDVFFNKINESSLRSSDKLMQELEHPFKELKRIREVLGIISNDFENKYLECQSVIRDKLNDSLGRVEKICADYESMKTQLKLLTKEIKFVKDSHWFKSINKISFNTHIRRVKEIIGENLDSEIQKLERYNFNHQEPEKLPNIITSYNTILEMSHLDNMVQDVNEVEKKEGKPKSKIESVKDNIRENLISQFEELLNLIKRMIFAIVMLGG